MDKNTSRASFSLILGTVMKVEGENLALGEIVQGVGRGGNNNE